MAKKKLPDLRNTLLTTDSTQGYKGKQPPRYDGNNPDSTLHYTYSLNGQPSMTGFPSPTRLGNKGQTPEQYLDNLPT